jgi:hypothetical protein
MPDCGSCLVSRLQRLKPASRTCRQRISAMLVNPRRFEYPKSCFRFCPFRKWNRRCSRPVCVRKVFYPCLFRTPTPCTTLYQHAAKCPCHPEVFSSMVPSYVRPRTDGEVRMRSQFGKGIRRARSLESSIRSAVDFANVTFLFGFPSTCR